MAYQREGPAVTYPKLLIFGDSIVQYSTRPGGFAELFAEKYERRVDVVVRGFSGYNSDHYPVIAPSVLRGLGPGPIDAIVVFIGTNDATITQSFQHVDLDRTLENTDRVLDILSEASKHVIVVVPAYCEDSQRDDRKDADFARYSRALIHRVRQYADAHHETKFHIINAREVLANSEGKKWNGRVPNYDPDALLDDGLHFTPFGYRKMFEAIASELRTLEEDWVPKLAPLEAFMHLSVRDQKALLKGHIAMEAE